MATEQQKGVGVVVGEGPLPLPVVVNAVFMANVGNDIQLMLGYADISELAAAIKSPQESEHIKAEIVGRFVMSPTTFAQMKTHMETILNSIKAQEKATGTSK